MRRAAAHHKSPSSKPPAPGEAGEEVVVEPAVVEPVVEAEEDPLAAFFSGVVPLAGTALGTARALEEEGAWVRSKFAKVLFKVLVQRLLPQTIIV